LVLALVSASVTPFNFANFFTGEFHVYSAEGSRDGSSVSGFSPAVQVFRLESQNDTSLPLLRGTSLKNNSDTFEVSELRFVEIEFSNTLGSAGVFKNGESLSDLQTLFEFNFFSLGENAVSFGKWNGGPSTYQFIVTSNDRFSLTIDSGADQSTILYFFGRRVLKTAPVTLWQKYGSTVMIGGVFLLNMYLQRNMRGRMDAAAPAPATTTGRTKAE